MITNIKNAKEAGNFPKFIDYIRFPFYKNFFKDTRINFDFPITVLVGTNGTGKSSILTALYGCCDQKSVEEFWFSTKVDEIKEVGQDRNCAIYNYTLNKITDDYEVLISRMKRNNNPDYWETSRPLIRYNMQKNTSVSNFRKSKIQMTPVYVDFHSILSAFVVYRSFLGKNTRTATNSYLRRKSNQLADSLNTSRIFSNRGHKQNEVPQDLTPSQLEIISNILERKYTSGKLIKHKFFTAWGTSIYLNTDNLYYSDAFAGSGETAITILVKQLTEAPDNSLILLDEPEVCLHPGAQKRLFEFLQTICLQKKHQIVISTHSPEFLEGLPPEAIKVFSYSNNEISVFNTNHPATAFYTLGAAIPNVKRVLVEDELGKFILEKVAKSMESGIYDQLDVRVLSGGASNIQKQIGNLSQIKDFNTFYILDGDQNRTYDDYKSLPTTDLTLSKLKEIVSQASNMDSSKLFTPNSNEQDDIKIKRYKQYLDYVKTQLYFFPLNIPEEIIWNDEFMRSLVCSSDIELQIIDSQNYKDKFQKLAVESIGDSTAIDIFSIQKQFTKRWIRTEDTNYQIIKDIITKIIS